MPHTPEQIAARFPNAYRFKKLDEALWFMLVAVVTVLAQELLTFDGTAITEWRTWAVALASAAVRAAAGALLAWLAKQRMSGEAA
ncbi:MAG: hypothetical protein AB7P40_00340 [Chloroflexota bacterium]